MGTDQKVVVCYAPEKKLVNPSPTNCQGDGNGQITVTATHQKKKRVNPLTNQEPCAIIKAQSGDAMTAPQQSRNATCLTHLEVTMASSPQGLHKTVN